MLPPRAPGDRVADDLERLAQRAVVRIADGDGIQTGLRFQCVLGVGLTQRDADDAPVKVVGDMKRGLGDDCEVGALERTDAEMDDASPQLRTVIAWKRDVRRESAE